MSASAGKVMPRPMGDYNASTEYKILDIVTYNDKPYMAKQTTKGNLPTNTTYWMLLLDFPTEVDNVPTQKSNNLVKSGGVYNSVAGKMDIDAGNAENISLNKDFYSSNTGTLGISADISKPAGEAQTVTLTKTITNCTADYVYSVLKGRIGDESLNYTDSNSARVYVILDAVSLSSNTITATGHLKQDTTDAIAETSKALYAGLYFDSNVIDSVSVGPDNAVKGDRAIALGLRCTAESNYSVAMGKECQSIAECGVAFGSNCVVSATRGFAAGYNTVAKETNQFVVGKNNNAKTNTLFEVGNGSSTSNRANALEVYSDGYISQNDGTDKYKFAKSGGIDGFYDTSGSFHPFYKELVKSSVSLSTSADKTVTFTDSAITADSTIEPFTNVWGINPKNVVASAGSCTLTFAKVSSATTIKVKIRIS